MYVVAHSSDIRTDSPSVTGQRNGIRSTGRALIPAGRESRGFQVNYTIVTENLYDDHRMGENRTVSDERVRPTDLRVLHIVSYDDATFFREQITELESRGITCDVLAGQQERIFEIPWSSLSNAKLGSRQFTVPSSLTNRLSSSRGHNIGNYVYEALNFYPRLLSATVRRDYDLVHVNSGLMAPFAFLQPQRPVVVSFWGSDLLGDYLSGFFPSVSKFCARRSDAAIVMSDEMADELDGIDCSVIPHGVDMDKFRPIDRHVAIDRTGWNEADANILFPYKPYREEKNVEMARAVAKAVDDRLPESVSFNVVCDVPHDDMPYYMNAADVMLVTSDHEGSPNTVKEAMACNLPIVSRNVGDVETRVRSVDHSYVCESFDELVSRTEAVLRAGDRSNGRPQIRELGRERMGDQLLDVYSAVLTDQHR